MDNICLHYYTNTVPSTKKALSKCWSLIAHRIETGRRLKVEECKYAQAMIQMNLQLSNCCNYKKNQETPILYSTSGLGKAWVGSRLQTWMVSSSSQVKPLVWFYYDLRIEISDQTHPFLKAYSQFTQRRNRKDFLKIIMFYICRTVPAYYVGI